MVKEISSFSAVINKISKQHPSKLNKKRLKFSSLIGTREIREEQEEIEDFKQQQVRKQHTINENLLRRCIENVPLELAPKTISQQPYEMPTTSTATFSLFNAELSSIPPPFTNQLPLTQTDAAYFVYHDDSVDENNNKMTSGMRTEFYSNLKYQD